MLARLLQPSAQTPQHGARHRHLFSCRQLRLSDSLFSTSLFCTNHANTAVLKLCMIQRCLGHGHNLECRLLGALKALRRLAEQLLRARQITRTLCRQRDVDATHTPLVARHQLLMLLLVALYIDLGGRQGEGVGQSVLLQPAEEQPADATALGLHKDQAIDAACDTCVQQLQLRLQLREGVLLQLASMTAAVGTISHSQELLPGLVVAVRDAAEEVQQHNVREL
mmetsp:Transcript_54809/g.95844  ORF Transcript_54809/g.95844 Transcript_54809/m.95844 type:complete len:224 (+) Transcript_54809:116-787(+)